MKKIILTSLMVTSALMADSYTKSYTSISSNALSGANVANVRGADASYYNPAASSLMADGIMLEGDLNMAFDLGRELDTTKTKASQYYLPSLHFVAPKIYDMRFTMSFVSPSNNSINSKSSASLKDEIYTYELNPSLSYLILENLSIAAGFSAYYSNLSTVAANGAEGLDFGYNLALEYLPIDDLKLATTYKSAVAYNVDQTLPNDTVVRDSRFKPALFNIAASYDVVEDASLELVYERGFYLGKNDLDDSNAIKFGASYYKDKYDFMFGLAYSTGSTSSDDFYAIDNDRVGLSLGGKYEFLSGLDFGAAFSYSKALEGEFKSLTYTGSDIIGFNLGVEYKF